MQVRGLVYANITTDSLVITSLLIGFLSLRSGSNVNLVLPSSQHCPHSCAMPVAVVVPDVLVFVVDIVDFITVVVVVGLVHVVDVGFIFNNLLLREGSGTATEGQ